MLSDCNQISMEWKEQLDDEGRSFVEFLRQRETNVFCVACSKPIAEKDDPNGMESIFVHVRSIEHGFRMFVMLHLEMQKVDLTSDNEEHCQFNRKQKKVEISRNADGSLKISGFNPIKYVVPIIDMKFMKSHNYKSETVPMSLDNYVTKEVRPSKRKGDNDFSEDNSSLSSTEQDTSPPKKRKTSQLTLERWIKNEEQQLDLSSSECPQSIPQQQVQSVTEKALSEKGLTRISNVRPAKRGISQIIRARVTIKSDIHDFFNRLGSATMFTLDLIDESGEMRLSAFGKSVIKLYPLVEVGRIYYFSKFKVRPSDPSKSPVISNYNITCTEDTIIRPCILTPLEFPRLKFSFQPISTMETMKAGDIVDVLAIIVKFGVVEHKRLANGSPGRSRGIWIVDQSNAKILMYIWGSNADNFAANRPGDVIAVKRAKLKNYAKVNLDSSCLSSSTFEINPQMPESDALRMWWDQNAKGAALKVLSSEPRPKKFSASKR